MPEKNKEKIKKIVINIVSEQLFVSEFEINEDDDYIKELQADSLDMVEIVSKFEETFNLSISDEDFINMTSINKSVNYIYNACN